MVARIAELGPAHATVHYFERDGYYAKNDPEHRRASFWHGRAAEAARLRGHVRPKRFEEVLAGHVPHTGIRLGRKRDGAHQHRPGYDITLSAPKSVSVEGLVFGEKRVVRAHDEAVRETLDWVESELLQTRGYDPVTGRRPRVAADGMVAAGFRHLTSRTQDPQLHTHCVVANMTRNEEGDWRSLEATKVRRNEKLIGAYYRNALAVRLQALGYAVEPTMVGRIPGFEIAGYGRELLHAFSGRRREILDWLEAKGLPYTAELAQTAALRTRRRKEDVGLARLIPEWRDRVRELGLERPELAARPPRPIDPETGRPSPRVRAARPPLPANVIRNRRRAPALPDLEQGAAPLNTPSPEPHAVPPPMLLAEPECGALEVVARAIAALEERRTVIPEAEVRALALGHAPGRYPLQEIDSAVAQLRRDGELVVAERPGTERAYATQRGIRAERRVLRQMREGRGEGRALASRDAVEEHLAAVPLTDGQRRAAAAIATSPDRVIGVQGHAGSGKTTMLRAAASIPGMPPVRGLAPSAAAVREMQRGAGIESGTLQRFLTRFGDLSDTERLARGRESYAGTVLAVDEASMVGTAAMEGLFRTAQALDVARVVLVGDSRQLRAVDAGQPFRVLQRAGMATTVMDEVLRQRDPGLKSAVAHVRSGDPTLALHALGERVRETGRESLGEAAAAIWLALPPEERAETAVLAPTHAIRREMHAAIREGLAQEGTLTGRTLKVNRLVDRRLTRADTADIRSYAEGDVVVLNRDVYGCRKDDICSVKGIGRDEVELAHPDGGVRRFRPSGNAARNLGVYDEEVIEIRAGDRVRWTRNRAAPLRRFGHPPAPALLNGDTAEVLAIEAQRVRFRAEDGKCISLARSDPQLRHLDHAYSSTVHAAQGRTARSVIAVLEGARLSDQTLLYVEMSRASDEFLLLTDDRVALEETLAGRPGREEGALEAIGEELAAEPVVEPETFEALQQDWAAVREQARACGVAPCHAEKYPEVMARVAALSLVEDLPADMRQFTGTLLASHEESRAQERSRRNLVQGMQSHWRRWPEVAWAEPAPPESETPARREWRKEAARMLRTARDWLAGAVGLIPSLDGVPGARTGLEAAERDMARVHARAAFPVFEKQWGAVLERADREGIPALEVDGYEEVDALGELLWREKSLSALDRLALTDWRERKLDELDLREDMEAFAQRAAACLDVRRALELLCDAEGDFDPAHNAYRGWRGDADDLMQDGPPKPAPGLHANRDLAAEANRAAGRLESQLVEDDQCAFRWLHQHVKSRAEAAGTLAYDDPRSDELDRLAQRLLALPEGLPPDTHAMAEHWQGEIIAGFRLRESIQTFPERAASMLAAGGSATGARELLAEGRGMLFEPGGHVPHLDAVPGIRNRIAASLPALQGAAGTGSQVAPEGAEYAIPCRERVIEGDCIRWKAPDHAFLTGLDSGGTTLLDCVVEAVETDGEDPSLDRARLCIEARHGSDGPAPGDEVRVLLPSLFVHGCARKPWQDEDLRARIELRESRDTALRQELYHERELARQKERNQGRSMGWSM